MFLKKKECSRLYFPKMATIINHNGEEKQENQNQKTFPLLKTLLRKWKGKLLNGENIFKTPDEKPICRTHISLSIVKRLTIQFKMGKRLAYFVKEDMQMENMHKKKIFSISKEMQIKATVRVYYTLTLECNKTDIFSTNHITLWLWTCFSIPIKCKLIREWKKKTGTEKRGGDDLEQLELSYIAGGNVEYTNILKSSTAVSYK